MFILEFFTAFAYHHFRVVNGKAKDYLHCFCNVHQPLEQGGMSELLLGLEGIEGIPDVWSVAHIRIRLLVLFC